MGLRRAAGGGLRPPLRKAGSALAPAPVAGAGDSEHERRSRARPGERLVDSRTGVEFYSMVHLSSEEAARLGRAGEKGVLSLSQLMALKRNNPDDGFRGLSGDDLVESAKRFLGPARVQLSEREIRQLQREREAAEREAAAAYADDQSQMDAEIEKLGASSTFKELYENPSNGV